MISIHISVPLRAWWQRYERLLSLMIIFMLCVCCGSFLLLILGPVVRAYAIPLRVWVPLPLLWWMLVIPAASYALLRQFLRDWQAQSPSIEKNVLPVAFHLSADELENRARRSGQVWQRKTYHALSLALHGYAPQEITRLTRLDEEQLIGLVFRYNVWGPRVLRARTGQLVAPA